MLQILFNFVWKIRRDHGIMDAEILRFAESEAERTKEVRSEECGELSVKLGEVWSVESLE